MHELREFAVGGKKVKIGLLNMLTQLLALGSGRGGSTSDNESSLGPWNQHL